MKSTDSHFLPQASFSFARKSTSNILAALCLTSVLSFLLTGCGSKKQARVQVPSPPAITPPPAPQETPAAPAGSLPPREKPETAPETTQETQEQISVPPGTKPILVETGLASWYGAPYHNRRGSNGQIYNMNAMTAAHRTLPLGSIVRVTNVKTGHSALVRITDRGPFVTGRILDLSQAAAKKVDVWLAGVAQVRIEVLQTPVPLDQGGRWAVQIGAFTEENAADQVADHLTRRYHSAKVLCFSSPVGDWWVRVRVLDDDRKRAESLAHETQTPEGSIFLVRLD